MAPPRAPSSRTILTVGCLFITTMLAASAVMIWNDRENALDEWQKNLSNFSIVLSEHTRQTIKAADLVLKGIADRVNELGIEDAKTLRQVMGRRATFDMLRDKASGVPQVDVATIVADNGDVINFTRSFPPPPINLADRDYFKAQFGDPNLQLFLSVPVQNRGTGEWAFYLARKIRSGAGETIGLALVGITTDFFESFYKAVSIGPESAISLFRDDGVLLARYPERGGFVGKSFKNAASFRFALASADSGTAVTSVPRYTDPSDMPLRVLAARRIKEYPLAINVSATEKLCSGPGAKPRSSWARVLWDWRRSLPD